MPDSDDRKSDLALLYIPKDHLATARDKERSSNNNKFNFIRFNDLKRSDAYLKKKQDLSDNATLVEGLCNRLVYNHGQQSKLNELMNHESLHTYSQVVEEMEKWEKKKADLKVIKRNPFGAMDQQESSAPLENTAPAVVEKNNPLGKGNNPVLGIINSFFTEEERKSHIKVYKLAWYPTVEPAYKNIECLEGASCTLVDGKAYILGGYSNDTSRMFFVYNVAEDKFIAIEPRSISPSCIMYHSAVALGSTIYLFGGDVTMGVANSKMTSNEIWSFETTTSEFKKIKTLKSLEARKHHAACDFGVFMLVSGGVAEESSVPFKDFHAYSPESEEWFRINDAVEWAGLSNHTMTPVYNSKVKNLYSKSSAGNKNKIDTTDVNCC